MVLVLDEDLRQEVVTDVTTAAWEMYQRGLKTGYLQGLKQDNPRIGGWKCSVLKHDDLVFTDEWGKNGGRVLIECMGILVWVMRYVGSYPKETIPCLKAALQESLNLNQFNGCRGPTVFDRGEFSYTNRWEGDFEKFRGHEEIYEAGDGYEKPLGSHDYWGGMLI